MADLWAWFKTQLLPFAFVGGLVFTLSFIRLHVAKPIWSLFLLGLLTLGLVGIGAYSAITSPPTVGPVVDEGSNKPLPDISLTTVQRLQGTWESEGPANWPVAETLASASEYAYLPPIEARDKYLELGFTDCMPFVVSSMIGYVVSVDDVTVIAFRGTDFDEVSDWLANLQRTPEPTEHGEIHAGFYNRYLLLRPQILQILSERKTKHLWVTGHSLGGALAVACAYDLGESEKLEIDGLITFGQPMVARRKLANFIDQKLLNKYARFVMNDDIVPRVPPSYVDCGSMVWFKPEGIKRSPPKVFTVGAPEGPANSTPKADEGIEQLTPISDAEFEALQSSLRATDDPVILDDGQKVYQTRRQFIQDHSMTGYVQQVRILLGIPTEN